MEAATDATQAEEVYEAIKKFVADGRTTSARYYSIHYRHIGEEVTARVGEPDPLTGETVIAILRSDIVSGPFYVCTPNRGVSRGDPILASSDARAVEFE